MVDAQSIHHALGDKLQDQGMRRRKDGLIFDPNTHQSGHFEKATVAQIRRAIAPVHQAPVLLIMQFPQEVVIL